MNGDHTRTETFNPYSSFPNFMLFPPHTNWQTMQVSADHHKLIVRKRQQRFLWYFTHVLGCQLVCVCLLLLFSSLIRRLFVPTAVVLIGSIVPPEPLQLLRVVEAQPEFTWKLNNKIYPFFMISIDYMGLQPGNYHTLRCKYEQNIFWSYSSVYHLSEEAYSSIYVVSLMFLF